MVTNAIREIPPLPCRVQLVFSLDQAAMPYEERQLEEKFIEKLQSLKYEYRPDILDRATLEKNFREKFEALNHVHLTDGEFARLLDEIITPDVFTAARILRERNAFTRDDGTPLNFTLVNIKDWCKNTFEVINQLRINTDYSHHRYDVILLHQRCACRADRIEDPLHQPTQGDGADRRLQERPRQRLHQNPPLLPPTVHR